MRKLPDTAGWILFILLAVYYFLIRYPGLAFIDSGELALCSYTLGVPHPTGYPLYIILTAPVAQLFNRPITGVTVFAGLVNALAGYLFYCLIATIRKRHFSENDQYNIATALTTLILFLSPVVAAQGVTNEVYGLALLINLAVVLTAVMAIYNNNNAGRSKYIILAWYLAGLSLCNHMSSVQLVPGLILVSFLSTRHMSRLKISVAAILAFVIPLTIYAVLPIRAAVEPLPIANWGDVTTWENFLRHLSGWQFQVWAFTGQMGELWQNFKLFIGIIGRQFPFLFLPFAVAGLYYLWQRARIILWLLLPVMVVNIFLGVNYSIPDIDSYYLLTIASLALLAIVGLFFVSSFVKVRHILPLVAFLLLVWQIWAVWDENYKADYTLPEDYALNIGRSADSGAVIMSELWDHHAQAFYLQQAEGVRTDLRFIDKELLRRSWYYKTIENVYPDLYAKIADLVPPFLTEIGIFESGGDFDAGRLELLYQSIVNRLLTECGPAYIDYRLSYTPRGDHYLRPQGILFKVDTIPDSTLLPQPDLIWRGRSLEDYTDWRARTHVEMIRTMTGYRGE